MNSYIKPSYDNAVRLNNILYDNYCFNAATGEWIFPFTEGTTSYYDVNNLPWLVMPLIVSAASDQNLSQADRDFTTAELATQLPYPQAVEAGWLPPPSDD
jgi:hypothetical protein